MCWGNGVTPTFGDFLDSFLERNGKLRFNSVPSVREETSGSHGVLAQVCLTVIPVELENHVVIFPVPNCLLDLHIVNNCQNFLTETGQSDKWKPYNCYQKVNKSQQHISGEFAEINIIIKA